MNKLNDDIKLSFSSNARCENVTDLTATYNNILLDIFKNHAPERKRTITLCPNTS